MAAGVSWLVPLTNETGVVDGMLYKIFKLHDLQQQNREWYWSRNPVGSIQKV